MPFNKSFDDVYATIKAAVAEAAEGAAVECKRLDEAKTPGRISEELVEALEIADFCVADLTGNNPNVMWEVGYAMALEKAIAFICQDAASLPFDLRDMRTVDYDRQALKSSLEQPLAETVKGVIRPVERAFASWKQERVVRGQGTAEPLRLVTDDGDVSEAGLHEFTQDLEDIELRLRAVDARISARYTLKRVDETIMSGELVGSGPVVADRAYISYRIEDHNRGQVINGVLKLISPQWGDITGYYLAQSYTRGASTVLGRVRIKRTGG